MNIHPGTIFDGQVVPASPVEETVEAGPEQLGIGAILTNNRLISDPWLASEISRSAFKMIVMTCASVSLTR